MKRSSSPSDEELVALLSDVHQLSMDEKASLYATLVRAVQTAVLGMVPGCTDDKVLCITQTYVDLLDGGQTFSELLDLTCFATTYLRDESDRIELAEALEGVLSTRVRTLSDAEVLQACEELVGSLLV